jgi:hypothetical protein
VAPLLTALVAIAVVAGSLYSVVVQPRPVWRDAAEHSKRFWIAWAAVSVAVGFTPAAVLGASWAAIAWLCACCAFAALQPAMFADVLAVRHDITRRRRARLRARQRHRGARTRR